MRSVQNAIGWIDGLSSGKIAVLSFILVGGYFLFKEHQAHILAALPYLIFLLCPLMHLFMHRGHGGHAKNDNNDADS